MSKPERMIVGLGNPGAEYAGTRHNAGWMVVERLAKTGFGEWQDSAKFHGQVARSDDGRILLLKPHTYMNDSGRASQAAASYYDIAPTDIIVVTDDADLPFGKLRYRDQGSSAGQKGLGDIMQLLGTNEVPRLRFGIGRPDDRRFPLIDYVLAPFSADEQEQLSELLDQAVEELRKNL